MRIVMCLVLLAVLYLSGCAVLDVSSMETAVPLSPGKFEVSNYVTNGLELPSAVVFDNIDGSESPSHDTVIIATTSTVGGYKLNVGIKKNLELCARYYANNSKGDDYHAETSGFRVGGKATLWQDHNLYFAIAPSMNIVNGKSRTWNGYDYWSSWLPEDVTYKSLGYEAQFIATYAPCPYISLTALQKYNFNFYDETYNGYSYPTQEIKHWGTKINIKIGYKPVFLIFEGGLETVPVVNGKKTYIETAAVGLGFRTWDKKK